VGILHLVVNGDLLFNIFGLIPTPTSNDKLFIKLEQEVESTGKRFRVASAMSLPGSNGSSMAVCVVPPPDSPVKRKRTYIRFIFTILTCAHRPYQWLLCHLDVGFVRNTSEFKCGLLKPTAQQDLSIRSSVLMLVLRSPLLPCRRIYTHRNYQVYAAYKIIIPRLRRGRIRRLARRNSTRICHNPL